MTRTETTPDKIATGKIPIVYLIDFFGKGGGTENQLGVLFDNLDRSRFSPYLFTLRPKDYPVKCELPFEATHLGITSMLSLKVITALFRFVRFLRKNQIAILQIFFVDSNLFGVVAGKLAGVSQIVVSRRDMGFWYDYGPLKLIKFVNRWADRCLVNAEAIKRVVAKVEAIPESRIEVIYNGVPLPDEPIDPSISCESLGIPQGVSVVGIVAHLKPLKRVDRFLRVAAGLADKSAHFLILGTGESKDELMKQAEDLGIAGRTHFHYTVDQIWQYMRLMNVGLLTSESEGLSNVLVEYALAGIPAVAFDVGGNSEAIVDGQTGYVIPAYDEPQMTKSVDKLLSDLQAAHTMGEQAVVRAREIFSVITMTSATQHFYERILESESSIR